MEQAVAQRVPPAVGGIDFVKLRTGRRDGRSVFSCLGPECSKAYRTWVRKKDFNVHLLQHTPECCKRYIYPKDFEVPTYQWRASDEQKLREFRDEIVNDCLTKLFHYSQHGMPMNPGPLPRLLFALGAIGSEYLEPWKTLRHADYICWVIDHLNRILIGSEWRQFVSWAEITITRLSGEKSLEMIRDKSDPETNLETCVMSNIIQAQIDALQEIADDIVICNSKIGDGLTAKHMAKLKDFFDDAISYMKIAAEFYWMDSFIVDPSEAFHEQVLFKFCQWKLCDDEVNHTWKTDRRGFVHGKTVRATVAKRQCNQSPSLGQRRFQDAEKVSSDDDEKYRPRFQRFDLEKEVEMFLRTGEMAKLDEAKLALFRSTIEKCFAPSPELSKNEQQNEIFVPRDTTQYNGRSNWQMRLNKWRFAAAAQGRNLPRHGDSGSQQTKDFKEGEAGYNNGTKKSSKRRRTENENGDRISIDAGDYSKRGKNQPKIQPQTGEKRPTESAHSEESRDDDRQTQGFEKFFTVSIDTPKRSKRKRPRSDSMKSTCSSKRYYSHQLDADSTHGLDIGSNQHSRRSSDDINREKLFTHHGDEFRKCESTRKQSQVHEMDHTVKDDDRIEMDTEKVSTENSYGQPPHLSAKEQFDVLTATNALNKALVPFGEIDLNLQLMSLCFGKEKDTAEKQVSFALNEREWEQRTRLKALSFAAEIASKYDPARFLSQQQGRKKHLRHLLKETLQRKLDESKIRLRWLCKEAESEIELITKAVQRAVDAIP